MKILEYLFVTVLFVIATNVQAQNWSVFANTTRYDKANLELQLHAKNENRVVFMGNSITEAWVNMRPEFFKGRQYIGRGISGQTTSQMLLRFRQDVIDLSPKVVVILAGTNDIAGNTGYTSVETIVGNIKSMAEMAHFNGIKVIISSILPAIDYPWKPGLEPASTIVAINKKLQEFAEKNNFVYLDYYSSLVDDNGGLKVTEYTSKDDLVHPNKTGYLVMEKLVESTIKEVLSN